MLEMLEVGWRAYDDASGPITAALGVLVLLSVTTTDHANDSLKKRLEPVSHRGIGRDFLAAIITTVIPVVILPVVVGIAIVDRKDAIVAIAVAVVFAVIVLIAAMLLITASMEIRSSTLEIAAHVLQSGHELAHLGCCCGGESGLTLALVWGTWVRLGVLFMVLLRH